MEAQKVDIDAVLAKVQKMLNVEGRTPEEAAAYVEKAHAILAQYDLTIEDVGQLKADPRTAVTKTDGAVATTTKGKPDGWKADLLRAVANAFECRVVVQYRSEPTPKGAYRTVKHYNLVGFKHDLEAARYAHSFLMGEITRQAKGYAKTHWDAIRALAASTGQTFHEAESDYVVYEGTHPLKAELYFIKGATQTVGHSLTMEAALRKDAAVAANPHGLVVQKEEALTDFIGQEQYGDKWPEEKARRARVAAEFEARRNTTPAVVDEKPETPAQARKREEREQREYRKWEDRWYREQAKIDHSALQAGQKAGRTMKVRPGIGGDEPRERI